MQALLALAQLKLAIFAYMLRLSALWGLDATLVVVVVLTSWQPEQVQRMPEGQGGSQRQLGVAVA
mgnify:CR=1 FL=1